QDLYALLLGRGPDAGGLAFAVGLLASGASLEQVRAGFVGSREYFQNHGGDNDGFLAAAYQDLLGRSLDPAGKADFLQLLASGVSRTTVATILQESQEYRQNLVQGYFHLLLHRGADPGGLAFFVSFLQNGIQDEHIRAAMAGSAEYLTRPTVSSDMQPPVIAFLSPVNGLTTRQNITITGQVTDDQTVASLQAAVDGGAFVDLSFDAAGNFSFTTTFPLDQSADGGHAIHFRATDAAGNTSNNVDFSL